MSCYDDQLNELSVAEYEMIWTLFHADKEDKKEDCHHCDVQEGVGVRLIRYLFGTVNDVQDDCAKYSEKRPYHPHIHQPVTRTRPNTHIGPDGTPWRAEPAPESSLIPAPMNPMTDGDLRQRGCCQDMAVPIISALVAVVMFLLSSYKLVTSSSTPPAAPTTSSRRPPAADPEDSEDID